MSNKIKIFERLRIFTSSFVNPITFSFFGYRCKRIDVLLQGASLAISFIIIVIKHTVPE
jgi:hypothetical protein